MSMPSTARAISLTSPTVRTPFARRRPARRRPSRASCCASASSRSSLLRSSISARCAPASRRAAPSARPPPSCASCDRARSRPCAPPCRSAPRCGARRRRRRCRTTTEIRPMSPVRRTCVPPHSSTDQPSVLPRAFAHRDDAHLVAVFLAEQRARAGRARLVERHQPRGRPARSAARHRWRCPRPARSPRRVIGLGCEKSKRSRSGATSEPFCAT